MSGIERFLREIHRRSLWQVLLVYVGASWAVIEAVQGLTDATGLPQWFPAFAVGLLLIGLPIVLATAFIQRGLPSGSDDGEHTAQATWTGTKPNSAGPEPAADARSSGTGSVSSTPTLRRLLTWRNAIGGGVLAMALWGVLATVWIVLGEPTGSTSPRRTSDDAGPAPATVAVLPFANMSPEADNAFFAAGVHEDILTQLSKIAALTVISRTSVLAYADTEKSVRQIGEELGAGAILEGSVRRAGDQVRISTQLIDARTDAHLWAETYDRRLDDVFRIQSEIATHVAEALKATLSSDEEARIARSPTDNLDAYDIYLRGREIYNEYSMEGNREAIRLFREAVELDRDFALAWAGLGDAYSQAFQRFGQGQAYADSAVLAAQRAVRLGPDLGEAHKALGYALSLTGRRAEALEAYFRSAELSPSHHAAMNNIGVMLLYDGRLDEALRWFRRAARIAPNQEFTRTNTAEVYTLFGDFETADPWLTAAEADFPEGLSVVQQRAYWHLFQNDPEAALETGARALEMAPEDPGSHALVGLLALWADRPAVARDRLQTSLDLAPGGGYLIHATALLLGAALMELGAEEEARRHIDVGVEYVRSFRERGDSAGYVEYDWAAAAALRGEDDEAIRHLEAAFDRGWRYGVRADDPLFASLRDDARYRALMAEVEADIDRMRRSMEAQERAEGIR